MASLLGRFAIAMGFKDLRGLDLSGLNLSKAKLDKANLTGANLDGCNLSDVNADGANFTGVSLVGANLRGASFARSDFERAKIRGCNLAGASFESADLRRINLAGQDLQAVDFTRANLSDAVLSGANLRDCVLTGAVAWNADLSDADARGANFAGAVLDGAKCDNADLSRANLVETAMIEASLRNTKMWDAELTRCKLGGANLSGIRMELTQLDRRQRARFEEFAQREASREAHEEYQRRAASRARSSMHVDDPVVSARTDAREESWHLPQNPNAQRLETAPRRNSERRPKRRNILEQRDALENMRVEDRVQAFSESDAFTRGQWNQWRKMEERREAKNRSELLKRRGRTGIEELDKMIDGLISAWEEGAEIEAQRRNGSKTSKQAQQLDPTRLYLDVPYEEKDEAKALGAYWDSNEERWFVPRDNVPEGLERWMPASERFAEVRDEELREVPDNSEVRQRQQVVSANNDPNLRAAVEYAKANRAERPRRAGRAADTSSYTERRPEPQQGAQGLQQINIKVPKGMEPWATEQGALRTSEGQWYFLSKLSDLSNRQLQWVDPKTQAKVMNQRQNQSENAWREFRHDALTHRQILDNVRKKHAQAQHQAQQAQPQARSRGRRR